MRDLQQQDRNIRRAQAREQGYRLDLEPTEQEQELLATQREEFTSDWSESQREQFDRERSKMWGLIPEEFRERAERLARGGM
jgi:hypothetical protein